MRIPSREETTTISNYYRRSLRKGVCQGRDRHCSEAKEYEVNIFDRVDRLPTASPTIQNTEEELFVPCVSDEKGRYGDISTEFLLLIDFAYAVETDLSDSMVDAVVLPLVEKRISDILITRLVDPEDCRDVVVRMFEQEQQEEEVVDLRSLENEIVGLSAAPKDMILPEVGCVSELAVLCHVVGAGLSLYGNDADFGDASNMTKIIIEQSMNNGEFDSIYPGVHRIRWFDGSDSDENNNGTPKTTEINTINGSDSSIPAWPWVAVAIGVVGLLACAYLAFRRKRNRNELRGSWDENVSGGDVLDLMGTTTAPRGSQNVGEGDFMGLLGIAPYPQSWGDSTRPPSTTTTPA